VGIAVSSTSSSAEVREPHVERQESHESEVIDIGSPTPMAALWLAREHSGQQPPENQGESPVLPTAASSSMELTEPTETT